MVWFVAVCAILVLLAASFAAVGRLGGMPGPVTDTFRPAALDDPSVPLDGAQLRFGREFRGYAPAAVDRFVAQATAGELTPEQIRAVQFPTATPGYAMEQVDEAVDRLAAQAQADAAGSPVDEHSAPAAGEEPADRE